MSDRVNELEQLVEIQAKRIDELERKIEAQAQTIEEQTKEMEEQAKGSEERVKKIEELEVESAKATRTIQSLVDILDRQSQQRNEGFARMLKGMSSYNPPKYDGAPDPIAFENWILEMEKGLWGVECPDDKKVKLASYFLVGGAELWWRTVKDTLVESSWADFLVVLRKQFFLPSQKRAKELEHLNHRQTKGMSVTEYTVKFDELARFAPGYMAIEGWSAAHYKEGLLYEIKRSLGGCNTLSEIRERALEIEVIERQEAEAQRLLTRNAPNNWGNRRKSVSSSPGFRVSRQGQISKPISTGRHSVYECRLCGKDHRGRSCAGKITCFRCGREDHKVNECPLPKVTGSAGASGSVSNSTIQRRLGLYAIGTTDHGTHEEFEGKVIHDFF